MGMKKGRRGIAYRKTSSLKNKKTSCMVINITLGGQDHDTGAASRVSWGSCKK